MSRPRDVWKLQFERIIHFQPATRVGGTSSSLLIDLNHHCLATHGIDKSVTVHFLPLSSSAKTKSRFAFNPNTAPPFP